MTKTDAPTAAMVSRPAGSLRRYAVIAGTGYVVLFVLALFANFVVIESLVVAGDATRTAANIAESEALFRLGLGAFMVVFLVDVVVAWALYVLFREVNRDLSLVTAWFRLVYTVLLGVALVFSFQALQLIDRADFLTVFSADQVDAQALVALDTFDSTWLIGLLAFGVHLVLLGVLVIRSPRAPRALGHVLMVAGAAYVLDTFAHSLLGNYADYETLFLAIVAVPSIVGEGWFGLWLLLRGGKEEVATGDLRRPSRIG